MKTHTVHFLTTVDLNFERYEVLLLIKACRGSGIQACAQLAAEAGSNNKPGLLVIMRDNRRPEEIPYRLSYNELVRLNQTLEISRPSQWDDFNTAEKQIIVDLRQTIGDLLARLQTLRPNSVAL